MNRENLLHAHAIGNAADGDGLLNAAVLLGNHSTLEHLDALPRALLHLHMDADGITDPDLGCLSRERLLVQFLNEIHEFFLLYL